MAYVYFNPNPRDHGQPKGDCVIRAISKVLNYSWDRVYAELTLEGYYLGDWGNSNAVWDSYLRDKGFKRNVIPNTCPSCYTVSDFCHDNPRGSFLIATGSHVVAVIELQHRDEIYSSVKVAKAEKIY